MIRFVSHSEVGGHPKIEDVWAIRPLSDGREGFLCALADGQGGRAGGARAAEVACQVSLEVASNCLVEEFFFPGRWSDILRKADDAVSNDCVAGFTTLIVFCVTPEFVSGASCGDSAAVLHSPARRGAILTERQFKNPPVGSGEVVVVPFFVRLESLWTLLAMSDGVWKYAGLDTILNLDSSRPVEEIVPALLARARLPNGGLQDDFTLVAFQQTTERQAASSQKER